MSNAGHKIFPADPAPNSAQLFMDMQMKLHECGKTMLNGSTPASVSTSTELVDLAMKLHEAVEKESAETIKKEADRIHARKRDHVAA